MNLLFFKLAFRNIIRNKLNSTINIICFSIGIATTLFIYLFIKHEINYDAFHKDSDRIYRILGAYHTKDGITTTGLTWHPTAPDFQKEIPGIEDFCRVSEANETKCFFGNELYKVSLFRYADHNFFDFFNFRLKLGNPETVLNSANKIVLTEKIAKRIFGDSDPLGKTIVYNQKTFVVSGISDNPPSNSQLNFDALISVKYIEQNDDFWLGWGGGMTYLSYLRLAPNVSARQVEALIPELLYDKINKQTKDIGFKLTASSQNIKEVHFTEGEDHYDIKSNKNKKSIFIVAGVGIIILCLAIINYVTLYTAQKITKIKDISLLGIHGAKRGTIMLQTFVEVFLVAAISSLPGILLLFIVTPFLNEYLNTSVNIINNAFSSLVFLILMLLSLSLVITLFSAQRTYRLRTIEALKGKMGNNQGYLPKGGILVAFQFSVVILLLICSILFSRQNNYLLNKELGFNKENILSLVAEHEFKGSDLQSFKQELLRFPEITSVCLTSQEVGTGLIQNGYRIDNNKELTMLNALYTDADFLNCFGIGLSSGRNFFGGTGNDENSILINHKLAKKAGWEDPLDKKIYRNGLLDVIGTVEDFNFTSLPNSIHPLLIMCNPAWDGWGYRTVNIRHQTTDIQALINKINKTWKGFFPNIPSELSFLDEMLAQNYDSLKKEKRMVSIFTGLSILISTLGLFGLALFVIRNRTKEIGIRKVNGAKIKDILAMLNKDFVKWVVIAFVIACPIAWHAMHIWLGNFAYKTEINWWIFVLAGVIALVIALLTVSWQSFRTASRNPVEALRYE